MVSNADNSNDNSFSRPVPFEIEPRLFLGTLLAFEQKFGQLTNKSHNVKLIIRCLPDDEYDSTSAKETCKQAHVELFQIPITDEANQNILLHLPAAVQKIHETLTNTNALQGCLFIVKWESVGLLQL
eukprot:PhF_6_TR7995/c1_g2_i1/m.12297